MDSKGTVGTSADRVMCYMHQDVGQPMTLRTGGNSANRTWLGTCCKSSANADR
jgi:hypothetical protein